MARTHSSTLVSLDISWAADAARVHREAIDASLPWLRKLHSASEDINYFQTVVFPTNQVWGICVESSLAAFIAWHDGWVDHLYVHPDHQRAGMASTLVELAKARNSQLQLWTFQRNTVARRFYERNGFDQIELTEGLDNEQKEPDVRLRWRR